MEEEVEDADEGGGGGGDRGGAHCRDWGSVDGNVDDGGGGVLSRDRGSL